MTVFCIIDMPVRGALQGPESPKQLVQQPKAAYNGVSSFNQTKGMNF